MERPKTESELQQEQSDELFARQLQEQLNNPSHSDNATPPLTGPMKSLQEAADAALARQLQEEINRQGKAADANVSSAVANDTVPLECPACSFVNYIKPSSSWRHWRCSQCREPLKEKAPHSSHTSQKDLVECKVCHSLNKLPSTKSDAVLCGGCYQELGLAHGTASSDGSEKNQRTVQLRCGQCNVINAVTVGVDVKKMEFICGGCGVLNSIVLE
ncbi:hypothetical protein LSCM1_02923 [Leishmania martiniquensis]|uniref:Uncharacterized protein n=1 Tax=Leishmania martiniquensis TaxID=1580590 RepID=A0A836KLT6_9TRYP|nr:hypothetical protein LSCM1_02923 [Leishmania martiniquensis]